VANIPIETREIAAPSPIKDILDFVFFNVLRNFLEITHGQELREKPLKKFLRALLNPTV
jgi:hypothetical protein